MAKVAFIQFLHMHMLGPMYLSSALKKKGHTCIVAIGSQREILRKLKSANPDIIAFSATVNERRWAIYMAQQIKEKLPREIPIIFGGPLATFSPEIINYPFIDMICRGEGELAMLDLITAVERRADKTKINNLFVKQSQRVFENELRPLISNLDDLEFPDRDLYREHPFIHNDPCCRVMITRGCPYNCSFCSESAYRQLYRESGYQARTRSVDNIIEELRILKDKYQKRKIWFIDDLFPLKDKSWLMGLLNRYSQEIALPFSCHMRVDLIDEEKVKMLKESRFCLGVSFGIETGNESYRKSILKKRIDNEQIKKAAALLRRYKLKFSTTNMMGLPEEQIEDAVFTIKLNRQIQANFSVCTVYQPLPKTELAEFVLKRRYIKDKDLARLPLFSHENSLLRQDNIKELINLHKFYYIIFYMPYLLPLIKYFVKLPNNLFYNMLYKISYFLCYMNKLHNFKSARLLQEAVVGFKYYHDKQ
ncbi:MAG: radical SAM protein [Candidatus Omnitrophica bacterium]|nr:radical SAM protein [Candidatus Omnitrophota bacterium]